MATGLEAVWLDLLTLRLGISRMRTQRGHHPGRGKPGLVKRFCRLSGDILLWAAAAWKDTPSVRLARGRPNVTRLKEAD